MRMSRLLGRRYKEKPNEASLESHALLLRGAYIRQLANGIYSLLPPARRVVRKIEQIIREEMDKIDGQEILMPVVLTRELWEESGRYDSVGNELLRFKDRNDRDMILGMTHEEAALHISRNEVSSYKQFPFMIYQIQTKFRDEKRPRGGLIRVREFTMKDAYSFHTNQEDMDRYYEKVANAYKKIFERVGLPEVVMIKSDTGMMGGSVAHEFMLLTSSGEDTIVTCEDCDYLANSEVATGLIESYKEDELDLEKIKTPSCKTIEEVSKFLNIPLYKNAKVVFYEKDNEGKPVMALIRGDIEINESKLSKIIKTQPEMANDETIKKIGSVAGFASPLGLDRSKYRLVVDDSIAESNNLVCGANEEDTHYKNFNFKRDCPNTETFDIAKVRDGDTCKECGGKILLKRGIEVGNIFQLGTKYSEPMKMRYLDESGRENTPIMGCYGIGVGRLMGSVMEEKNDKYGPIWPISISPWHVHINAIKYNKEEVKKTADDIYQKLTEKGIEVLLDDRNERPGSQFADADLLGIPYRIIVSDKNLADNMVEWKKRDGGKESFKMPKEEIVDFISKRVISDLDNMK